MRDIYVIVHDEMTTAYPNMWYIQNIILQEIPFCLEDEVNSFHDSVVIYLTQNTIDTTIIQTLRANRNKVVLCHFGDEHQREYDRDIYLSCDLNIRTNYFQQIFADEDVVKKTIWIPIGFKTGVGPRNPTTLRKANKRRYLASFLGWLDNLDSFQNERTRFKTATVNCPYLVLHETTQFNQGHNTCYYSMYLEHSIFCPCPAGYSPETIRLFDALEMGAIPISLNYEFLNNKYCLTNPPFTLLDNWGQLPQLLTNIASLVTTDMTPIMELQSSCINWWQLQKASISQRIADRLMDLRLQ